jgi:hypothetical protein
LSPARAVALPAIKTARPAILVVTFMSLISVW